MSARNPSEIASPAASSEDRAIRSPDDSRSSLEKLSALEEPLLMEAEVGEAETAKVEPLTAEELEDDGVVSAEVEVD